MVYGKSFRTSAPNAKTGMRLYPPTGAALAIYTVLAALLFLGFVQLMLFGLSTNHVLERHSPYIVIQVLVLFGLSAMELWLRRVRRNGYKQQARPHPKLSARRRY